MGQAWQVKERKVPGGKLLRLKVRCERGKMLGVRLEGDFFVHPEEAVGWLEKALEGKTPKEILDDRGQSLYQVMEERNVRIIGFSVSDVIDLLEGLECSGTDGA